MKKNLVIVESPSKAKTINKYLGKNYIVEATIGHLRNLPKTKLGVEIEKGFEPQFVNIRGKGDVIKKIKDLANKSEKIFIATDPDREGEAIAQDIAELLTSKKPTSLQRVLFNEITKTGIMKGMANPLEIDAHLVHSQRARRVMDRIIGYKISPFLWKTIISSSNNLSAGRVQSVALRLVCEREEEIEKFIQTEYWSISGIFGTAEKSEIHSKLFSIDGREVKVTPKPEMTDEELQKFSEHHIWISNETQAQEIVDRIKGRKDFVISNIVRKATKRNPSAPFITSTLQAEASKALRFRPRQTMTLAQRLYEGVELGDEGLAGLITYMRTDSTRLSEDIVEDARQYISSSYGQEYVPAQPNVYKKKGGANVQDAHEAIRPTSLKYTPEFVRPYLDDGAFKLYQLIWNRFISCQMNPASLETTVVEIKSGEFLFKAYGQTVLFDGFTRVYTEAQEVDSRKDEDRSDSKNERIPKNLEKGGNVTLIDSDKHQHFTKPAPRYTEASLIKELESKGIGRPSTYSMIVSTIVERGYVEQENRQIIPTNLGKKVNKVLVDNFPDIINTGFTAKMENELDQVAQGENEYINVLNDFYIPFADSLVRVEQNTEKILCEKCGSEMAIKYGRFGRFLACTNYPECKNIKSMKELNQENNEPEYTGETCEKCGGRTVIRMGKFGRFIGCEKYPDCDFVKNLTLGIPCPKCQTGEVVERLTKKRKPFYGCSKYPGCDFVSWQKPVMTECPNHDSTYMEQWYSKKKGKFLKCPVCSTEIVEEMPEESEE
jgi:DNA topoisomerase-1